MKLKRGNVVKMVSTPKFSDIEVFKLGAEYAEISDKISELMKRKKQLSDLIKQGAEDYGAKDDKGSYYLENSSFILGKVAKKSMSLDEEKAVQILESLGLDDVIDTVTVKQVNEDKLTKAVSEGRISFEDVEEFTNTKVSYSVLVKHKEELPEVKQVTFKKAASKK